MLGLPASVKAPALAATGGRATYSTLNTENVYIPYILYTIYTVYHIYRKCQYIYDIYQVRNWGRPPPPQPFFFYGGFPLDVCCADVSPTMNAKQHGRSGHVKQHQMTF